MVAQRSATIRKLFLVVALLVATCCGGRTPLGDPPLPEDLEAVDVALAEWIWKLDQAFRTKPDGYREFLNLCLLYQANDQHGLARRCLEQLVEARPDPVKPWYFLAHARHQDGDTGGALAALGEVLRRAEHYTAASLRLGDWSQEAGDLAAAGQAYARVLRAAPANAPALLGQARLALERGEPQGALDLTGRVLAADPADAWAVALQRLAEEQILGARDVAGTEVLPGWSARPIGDDPWVADIELFWVGYRARLELADQYLAAGRPETALDVLEDLVQRYPEDLGVLLRLGRTYLGLDRGADALATLEAALRGAPEDFDVHLELAAAYEVNGRSESALEHIGRALALRPASATALARQGAILRGMQRIAEALDAFRRAAEISPADRPVLVAIADCELRLKLWEDAARSYERALALDAQDAEALSRVGLVYLRLGRLAQAEHALEQALVLGLPDPEPIAGALAKVRQLRAAAQSQ